MPLRLPNDVPIKESIILASDFHRLALRNIDKLRLNDLLDE